MDIQRLSKNFLLALAAILVTAVVFDLVAYYILDIKEAGYRSDRFFEFSTLTGYMHRSSVRGFYYRYLDGTKVEVATNRFGFADIERDKEGSRPRIALIGDSTTEFWEVEEKERGQYVLERVLDGKFEVLNCGVRGFGTDQTLVLLENLVVDFSPDIIVYTFCINDIADNLKTRSKPYFVLDSLSTDGLDLAGYPIQVPRELPRSSFLYAHSFIYRHIQELRNTLMLGTRLRRWWARRRGSELAPPRPHSDIRPYRSNYSEDDKRGMEITTRLIDRLGSFARARRMKLLVVEGIYRPAWDDRAKSRLIDYYGDIFDFDRVTRTLQSHCLSNDIAFLSLPVRMNERGLRPSDLMHRQDNMHLDSRGVRFFAEEVAEKLAALGWIEAEQ